MPRYLVTSGSHFEPMTYDELVKPIAQMTDALNATQDAYDTLNLETKSLANYISQNPGDTKAREMYDNYVSQLDSLQNELWNNGYTARARRELSAARSGYASDITRLQKAIQTRQEHGKTYSELRLKDPSLVMGDNPANAGLDAYLADDNYGLNYFTYSGNSFMTEVAADAKARMNEMLNDPQYSHDPALQGYIIKKQKEGFTSTEVALASDAVRTALGGNSSKLQKLDPASSILASVLMSHLNSTGAQRQYVDQNGNIQGNLSPDEFNRLVEYGVSGLSQAIGKEQTSELNDKQWDLNKQMAILGQQHRNAVALENLRHDHAKEMQGLKNAAKNGDGTGGARKTGIIMGVNQPMTSAGYESFAKATKSQDKYFTVQPDGSRAKTVFTPDGKTVTVTNPYELTDLLYHTEASDDVQRRYGIDVMGKVKKITKSFKTKDGRDVKITFDRGDDGYIVATDANGNVLTQVTERLHNAQESVEQNVNDYKSVKGNEDIEKAAISPREQQKLREENGYDEKLPWSQYYNYITAKEFKGDYSPGVLAGSDKAHEMALGDLNRASVNSYRGAVKDDSKRFGYEVPKGDRRAIYKVGYDGVSLSKEPINGGFVYGTDKEGNLLDNTMTEVTVTMQDLMREHPMIRFKTNKAQGTYAQDAFAFSPMVENRLLEAKADLTTALLPFSDPNQSLRMRGSEDELMWAYDMYKILGLDENGVPYMPMVRVADGQVRPATASEIIMNPELREQYRAAVNESIVGGVTTDVRKALGIKHEQVVGVTSSSAK